MQDLVDILIWALDNPGDYGTGPNLVVISKNIKEETDFVSVLEALKGRGYNVILALPDKAKRGVLRPRLNPIVQTPKLTTS